MTESIEKDQLENICSSLLRGFIEWIDINNGPEKAIILDSAYQFKLSMLEQENETLQKKYFLSSQDLSREELIILLGQWKETFTQLINSDLDLSLIHISEPTRLLSISYAVFCLKKKNKFT